MDTLLTYGFCLVAIGLIAFVISTRNKSKNTPYLKPLDPADIPTALRQKGRLKGEYRSHQVRVHVCGKVDRSRANISQMGTRIIVEAGDFSKDNRPLPAGVPSKKAIMELLAPTVFSYDLGEEIFVATKGQRVIYEQFGLETDIAYLQFLFDFLVGLIESYPLIVQLGGEAIPSLHEIYSAKSHILHPIIPQLLRDIELETTDRLGRRPAHFLCLRCWVRCAPREYPLSRLQRVRYYGCRDCGQSREVIEWRNRVTAVLDRSMTARQKQQRNVLYANWFAHEAVFDFDEVQIVQATDEDVERFAVKIGNDTDEIRRPNYERVRCTVSSQCRLSPNTMRILHKTFGHVEVDASQKLEKQGKRAEERAGSSRLCPDFLESATHAIEISDPEGENNDV